MAVNLSPVGGVAGQFFDNNGNPLAGGKIFTYSAGTTTNQATYTSATGAIAHSNPIILDGAGRVPSGEIWLTDGLEYKFVIKDNVDALIGTFDNIIGINSNFVNFTNQQELQTATAGQTVFTLTTMQYQPATNSLSVFVDGVNQYGPGALYAYVETDSMTVTFTAGLHVGAEVKFTTSNLNSSAGGTAAGVSFTGFKGQVGNVQDLADDDGSDWIGFEQAGAGAVAISAQDKMRQIVSVKDFGAVGDGVTDDTVAIQAAIDAIPANSTLVFPIGSSYFVGDLAGDTAAFTITKNIRLICNNSTFICTASGAASAATMFKFVDCKAYVDSMQLDQTNFSFVGTNRGVVAVLISAQTASVNNHYVKTHVIKGQSPLTVVTADPLQYRSGDIEVYLTGDTTYYGINLASNGDRVRGSVYAYSYLRLFYGYDIDDVDLDLHGGADAQATSGQLNIFNKKVLPTSNIKLRAVFDALNGPIIIDDLTDDAGTAKFVNIDLDIYVKSFLSNMSNIASDGVIRVGSFDGSGNWETNTPQSTEVQLDCSFKSVYDMTYPAIYIYTPSTGRRVINLQAQNAQIFNNNLLTWYTINGSALARNIKNSSVINVPIKDIQGFTENQIFILDVIVSVRENTAFLGQNTTTERWEVHGFTSSLGILNIQAYNRVYTSKTGAKTATITMAATGTDASFNITATGYTISSSHLIDIRADSLLV
jgi:hypothetical protein